MNLKTLYKLIPDIKCVEGCTDCCSPVYMLPSEAKRIGVEGLNTKWDANYDCEFKTATGCSIYENRPFICRFFGCSEHGIFSCNKVTGNLLSEEKANALLGMYIDICIKSNNMPSGEIGEAMHRHDQLMDLRGIKLQRLREGERPTKFIVDISDQVKPGN